MNDNRLAIKTVDDGRSKYHNEKIRFTLEKKENLKKSLSINDMFSGRGDRQMKIKTQTV